MKKTKSNLLDSIERCTSIELNRIGPNFREKLAERLSQFDLRCLERAFLLAYQEGFERGIVTDEFIGQPEPGMSNSIDDFVNQESPRIGPLR